jgi:hypothetical protein
MVTIAVSVDIGRARVGLSCIEFARGDRLLTPAEAAEMARDLQTAADFAIGLDGTATEGAPVADDEEPF